MNIDDDVRKSRGTGGVKQVKNDTRKGERKRERG